MTAGLQVRGSVHVSGDGWTTMFDKQGMAFTGNKGAWFAP